MNKRKVFICVPVRLDSKRVPGKALLEVGGKPILDHVVSAIMKDVVLIPENVCDCEIVVISDSLEVAQHIHSEWQHNQYGMKVDAIHDTGSYNNGTDRIAVAIKRLSDSKNISDEDLVINVQCDQVAIPKNLIGNFILDTLLLKSVHSRDRFFVHTVMRDIDNDTEVTDRNRVKVFYTSGEYPYFCRKIPPHKRHPQGRFGLKLDFFENCGIHIGIYGFDFYTLKHYYSWGPYVKETENGLEQLRFLYGKNSTMPLKFYVSEWVGKEFPRTVDSMEDLKRLEGEI